MNAPTKTRLDKTRDILLPPLHIAVLLCAIGLIAYITYDTLKNISFVNSLSYVKVQFWACLFFEVEIFIEFLLSKHRWRFLLRNVPFIIICLPIIPALHHFGIHVTPQVGYLLRFIPMIRAAYVMAIMWGFMQKNWISGMFGIYIVMLVSTLYFLSLMFFVEEHHVNHQVYSYWQSLWYSVMQMTTCGSNISAVTPTGKVIGVILSAEGLILFPVFTVYFTHAFSKNSSTDATAQNPQ